MKYQLTTEDICEIYGVSRQAVAQWRARGLKSLQKGPKKFRYDPLEVDQFVKTKTKFVNKG